MIVAQLIIHGKPPPLHNSPITAHLSASAIDLIDRLMQRDPHKRLTADQMLEHPWTKGITANRDKMADSDKKLSMYRVYKSGIAEKVFENIISWSDDKGNDDVSRRTSLIERSFRSFDSSEKGYLTRKDLQSVGPKTLVVEADDQDSSRLSLSGFSDLLAENMKNRYVRWRAVCWLILSCRLIVYDYETDTSPKARLFIEKAILETPCTLSIREQYQLKHRDRS